MKQPVASVFEAALHALVGKVKEDRAVLAAIICGSMSHDAVWAKSDIDLLLVTIDDKKVPGGAKALNADGVNVHAMLMPRAEFRKTTEGTVRNSFMHSLIAKGRILYSKDPTIDEYFAGLKKIGDRDTKIQTLSAMTWALFAIYKAHKFFLTRGDLEYTSFWILQAAPSLARVEVLAAKELAGREVIQQALKLNPKFFNGIYTDLLNSRKSKPAVRKALDAVDTYVRDRAKTVFAPVLEYLKDAGEARTATELEDHFMKNYGIESAVTAAEYLSDQGMIGKAGRTIQLTKKSTGSVEELAFFYLNS